LVVIDTVVFVVNEGAETSDIPRAVVVYPADGEDMDEKKVLI